GRDQPCLMEDALEFRAAALEINRAFDAWLRREQFFRVSRRQSQKNDFSAGRRGRDGTHIGQMPDDVADPLLGLYDDGGRHGFGSCGVTNSQRLAAEAFAPASRILRRTATWPPLRM